MHSTEDEDTSQPGTSAPSARVVSSECIGVDMDEVAPIAGRLYGNGMQLRTHAEACLGWSRLG